MKDFLDRIMTAPSMQRMSVPLKDGEVRPNYSYLTNEPPEGHRWETDAEVRLRRQRAIGD